METEYKIKIDLPPDVAAKYLPVEFRQVEPGEWFLFDTIADRWNADTASEGRYLILTPRVEWPAWCSADWIAKEANGRLTAFGSERPQWHGADRGWASSVGGFALYKPCHADLYAAFEHIPTELSLIENPKRTKA